MDLPVDAAGSPAPTFDPASVEAVVFDLGGVFVYPEFAPALAALDRLDPPVAPPPDGDVAFRRAHHAAVLALSQRSEHPDEHDPELWRHYDRAYAAALGVPPAQTDDLVLAGRSWDWPHDENIAAFHRLHAAGMPIAIVSNNDGTAPEQCRQQGICQVLDGPLPRVAAIIDSSLVGVAKPDPAIMAPALYALGLPAERVLYVGDTVHADVAGAGRAGMQVVQLDPFDHHAAYDHARIADVGALVDLLVG